MRSPSPGRNRWGSPGAGAGGAGAVAQPLEPLAGAWRSRQRPGPGAGGGSAVGTSFWPERPRAPAPGRRASAARLTAPSFAAASAAATSSCKQLGAAAGRRHPGGLPAGQAALILPGADHPPMVDLTHSRGARARSVADGNHVAGKPSARRSPGHFAAAGVDGPFAAGRWRESLRSKPRGVLEAGSPYFQRL